MQNPARSDALAITEKDVLRIRAIENMTRSWQFHQGAHVSAANDHDVFGEDARYGPIHAMWEDASNALSATPHLHTIGYSLPADDIEKSEPGFGPRSPAARARPEVHPHGSQL